MTFVLFVPTLTLISRYREQFILSKVTLSGRLVLKNSLELVTFNLSSSILLPDQHQKGNLFTLFLHSPLTAFCYICNIVNIPVAMWDKCQAQIDKFIAEASKLFTRSRSLGMWIAAYVHISFDNIRLIGSIVFNRELFIKFITCCRSFVHAVFWR